MNMDTKAPTTPTNITLDHPYQDLQATVLQLTEQVKQLVDTNPVQPSSTNPSLVLDHPSASHDLQTTVLQLTEQVKQLQRELGVQIGKFNERVRPLEAYLKNEEKKNQRIEELRRGLRPLCGTGQMIMEENRKKREKESRNNGVIEYYDWEEIRKGRKVGQGKKEVGESSRGGKGESK